MRSRAILAVAAVLAFAGAAQAALDVGDRILVDIGLCWDSPDYPGVGTMDEGVPCSDGNYWNNLAQNYQWNKTPVDLVDTDGNATGATILHNQWSGCGEGEQIAHTGTVNGPYPAHACSDVRWWSEARQSGTVHIASLNPALTYDIALYGSVKSGQLNASGALFPEGTTVYTIGGTSLELDVMDNLNDIVTFTNVATDASGDITILLDGGTPSGCMAVIGVVDITAVPEPTAMFLLALGGPVIWRRRRG
jgi:hypothetical protein